MSFPFAHRTVAEMDEELGFLMGSRLERRHAFSVSRLLGQYSDPGRTGAQIRSSLPSAPCPRCGARGYCGHVGRIAA